MGGGGAMRAVAKVAGIGVFNGGIRSAGLAENPISRAAVALPSSSISDGGVIASQTLNIDQLASVQKPIWDEEWDLSAGEEYFAPRPVFGPAPSLEEAKEATSELNEAIDKIYFSSPKFFASVDSIPSAGGSDSAAQSQQEDMKDITSVTVEHRVIPSLPHQAIKAFELLRENAEAQMVVASIASDPNVWSAVLQNKALQGYLRSGANENSRYDDQQSSNSFRDSSTSEDHGGSIYGFMNLVEDIKNRVVDMVNNLTEFIQSMFGGSAKRSAFEFMEENQGPIIGGSFLGLAVLVIIVVLVRRA